MGKKRKHKKRDFSLEREYSREHNPIPPEKVFTPKNAYKRHSKHKKSYEEET